jgi:hypothetical protein
MDWLADNWDLAVQIYLAVVGLFSVIIKLIPVLPKNHKLLPVIKVLAKCVALNKAVSDKDRPGK